MPLTFARPIHRQRSCSADDQNGCARSRRRRPPLPQQWPRRDPSPQSHAAHAVKRPRHRHAIPPPTPNSNPHRSAERASPPGQSGPRFPPLRLLGRLPPERVASPSAAGVREALTIVSIRPGSESVRFCQMSGSTWRRAASSPMCHKPTSEAYLVPTQELPLPRCGSVAASVSTHAPSLRAASTDIARSIDVKGRAGHVPDLVRA
jgi:hypothetical protein